MIREAPQFERVKVWSKTIDIYQYCMHKFRATWVYGTNINMDTEEPISWVYLEAIPALYQIPIWCVQKLIPVQH